MSFYGSFLHPRNPHVSKYDSQGFIVLRLDDPAHAEIAIHFGAEELDTLDEIIATLTEGRAWLEAQFDE